MSDNIPDRTTEQPSGRESLSSRAQRVIGRTLDIPEEHSAESSRQGARRRSPNRRRDQVLQAQRIHRQRTQNYIRELENEVFRLRQRENDLLKDVEGLKGEIESLKGGVAISTAGPESLPLTTQTTAAQIPVPTVHVDLTELSNIQVEPPDMTEAGLGYPAIEYRPPTIDLAFRAVERAESNPASDDSDPDTSAQSGINFILELEKPCLPHVKHGFMPDTIAASLIPEVNISPRHALTTTSMLLANPSAEQPETHSFDVPVVQIDRLLETSSKLCLGPDEVTPVQIWANLRNLSKKYMVDSFLISQITDEFKMYVRCNHYGGVVSKDIVELVFGTVFPGEEYSTDWN